jgi:hypothetical protein
MCSVLAFVSSPADDGLAAGSVSRAARLGVALSGAGRSEDKQAGRKQEEAGEFHLQPSKPQLR